MRAVVLVTAVGVILGPAGSLAQQASVRVPMASWGLFRTAAEELLGWKVGIPAAAFPQLTFLEAAAKADALGLATVEGSSTQRVSPEVSRNLDFHLTPAERNAVVERLRALRVRMPVYQAESIPPDEDSRRELFEFAKSLGVETIVARPDPAWLPALDELALGSGINVAVANPWAPERALRAVEGRSWRVGVCADLGSWMEQGIRPEEGLAVLKNRLMAVHLRDRSALGGGARDVTLGSGAADLAGFFRAMYRLEAKPIFLAVEATGAAEPVADLSRSFEGFDKAIHPVLTDRVAVVCRSTPVTGPDQVPAGDRRKIEAALPRQAPAKPMKPRKLLVMDISVGYVHATAPYGNLALGLMGKYTGAYEAVFSNDLDNLKYDKLKQFDAVFLNDVVGAIFTDPEIRRSLVRFVREGGGLGGLHGASYASLDWPEFTDMIGAGEGPHHVETATIKIDDPHSPLTAPFHGQGFTREDEFYHFLPAGPYSRDKLHVLLSIDVEKSDLSRWSVRPDNDYGMSWIRSYGKGRVFFCAMGHTPSFFMTPALAGHVLAGIQFALGDLAADATPSARLAAVSQR